MNQHIKPIALTMGEPAGIGPEIALRAWQELRHAGPHFVVFADPSCLQDRIQMLGLDIPVNVIPHAAAPHDFQAALPVVPLNARVQAAAGVLSSHNAAAVIESIEAAFESVRGGVCQALVTNPLHKSALYEAGFSYPGHTEFLGALCARHNLPATPVMMMSCDELRTVPVTVHRPLAKIAGELTVERIVETARVVNRDLRARFGITAPRLAVAGFNPHAGENGAMGDEEQRIIAPAIAQLKAEGLWINGPYPADTLFHESARARYDAALCMYHDQALIPVKTLAFDRAVNITLGLPFLRTSPDHGTALDIAARGIASAKSLLAALKVAAGV